MNDTALCFFCGLSPSTHPIEHSLLGHKPICDDCDPNPQTPIFPGDLLDKMIGTLVARVQLDGLDLGDERAVDLVLRESRYGAQAIEAFQERATEQARRQMQRVAHRYRPFEAGAEIAAFALMISAWVVGFAVLNPPARAPQHVHFAQVQR